MTPNAKATAHQRVPVGRCGVALPVFPKNSQIFIIPRGIIPVNTVHSIFIRNVVFSKKRFASFEFSNIVCIDISHVSISIPKW